MNTAERILQFADTQSISRRKFYEKIGVSNGLLSKSNNVGSEILEKIHKVYPELNMLWILHGEGNMLIEHKSNEIVEPIKQPESLTSQMLEEVRAINEKITTEIEFLRQELTFERNERRLLQELLGKH